MKLRNKLIPIISAATVAATIAPLSSCTIGETVVDLINGYTPSIKKAVWEDFVAKKDDMLSFYASAVNENPEIFAQDMYWKYCVEKFYDMDAYPSVVVTPTILEALTSDVKVNKLTCYYDEGTERKETYYYTISFNFQLHYAYSSLTPSSTQEFESNVKFSVKNIPFTINRTGTRVYHEEEISTILPETSYNPLFNFDDSFKKGYLSTSWVIQPLIDESVGKVQVGTTEAGEPIYEYRVGKDANTDAFDHTAFTRIEKNGYEWFAKYSRQTKEVETPYITKQPKTETTDVTYEFKEDSQFDKANNEIKKDLKLASDDLFTEYLSLDTYVADGIFNWYLPTYYLSNIEDKDNQLWSIVA